MVTALRNFLGDRGKPTAIYTDGGTHFTGHEMSEWTRFWDIRHHVSSPGWPQGNAWAEAGIKRGKSVIAGVIHDYGRLVWDKVQYALVVQNNTPMSGRTVSPAVLVSDGGQGQPNVVSSSV